MKDFDHLIYKGQDKLYDFVNKFQELVQESHDELSDATLCEILLQKIEEKEPLLAPDCAAWRRMDEDDPQRNLEWLMKAMLRVVEMVKLKKNQKDRESYLAGANMRRGQGVQMQASGAGDGEEQKDQNETQKDKKGKSRGKSKGKNRGKDGKKGKGKERGADVDGADAPRRGKSAGKERNRVDFTKEESDVVHRRDENDKTPCIWLHQPGGCRKGNKCPHSHAAVDDHDKKLLASAAERITRSRSRSASVARPSKSDTPCRFWVKFGDCRHGTDCPFLHESRGDK